MSHKLSRGRQRYLDLQMCENAAWGTGPIETVTDPRFDKWYGSGFADVTHGASVKALNASLTTRWRFAFPYHDTDPEGGEYIRAVYPTPEAPRAVKAWYDTFDNWAGNTSVVNLRSRIQVVSLGDEFYDMFNGDLTKQLDIAQRFETDRRQLLQYQKYRELAARLLVEVTGAGITQLTHGRRVQRDGSIEAYHRTASTMYGFPYRNFSFGETPAPNAGEAILESHSSLFQTLTRMGHMRKLALLGNAPIDYEAPIPCGNTISGLKLRANEANGDSPVVDTTRYRPSDSQLCFQQYAAWTYGALWTCWYAFDIDAHHSILFEGGTPATTAVYERVVGLNARGRHVGRALVNLISTDVRLVLGRKVTPADPPEPQLNYFEGLLPYFNQPWYGDDLIDSVEVKNLGGANNGRTGLVLIGYFKPIARDLVDPQYADDTYLMVTNGLAMVGASPADGRQEVAIKFKSQDGYDRLQRLDEQGNVVQVPVTPLGDGLWGAKVILDGGCGELFKLARGPSDAGFKQLIEGRDTLYYYPADKWDDWGYVTGRNENGGRSGFASQDSPGFLVVGPYTPLQHGAYAVRYRVFVDDNSSASTLVKLDFASDRGAKVYSEMSLNGTQFAAPYVPQEFTLNVMLGADITDAEFRLWWAGHNAEQSNRGSVHLSEVKLIPYTILVRGLYHATGKDTPYGWLLDRTNTSAGWALYGPYLPRGTLRAGLYTAYFRIAAAGNVLSSQPILKLDVVKNVIAPDGNREQVSLVIPDERHPAAQRDVLAKDLGLPASRRIAVPFIVTDGDDGIEFRAHWAGLAGVDVLLEDITLVPFTLEARTDLTIYRGRPEGEGLAVTGYMDEGFVAYGPYAKLPAGRYRASFRLMANEYARTQAANVDLIHIDVAKNRGEIIKELRLMGGQFTKADAYQDFTFDFDLAVEIADIECRAYWTGFNRNQYRDVYINFSKVILEKID